jgi:hypothetical protein
MNLDYTLTSHIIYVPLNNNPTYNCTAILTPHNFLFHLMLCKASLILRLFAKIMLRLHEDNLYSKLNFFLIIYYHTKLLLKNCVIKANILAFLHSHKFHSTHSPYSHFIHLPPVLLLIFLMRYEHTSLISAITLTN